MNQDGCSTFRAAVNLAKVCIGAGVLALPYATEKGGLLFSPLVIGLVAAWNAIACRLMIECKNATRALPVPVDVSSTYAAIAYHGAGYLGVYVTDFSIVVTLLGVCVAYQITFSALLSEIPFVSCSHEWLMLLSFLLLLPVAVVKDVGALSGLSLVGLLCLVIGIAAILVYGAWAFGAETLQSPLRSTLSESFVTLWPTSLAEMTTFFGVAAFCFGLCSMAFPIEESMRHKEDFGKAVLYSVIFVWIVYAIIGDLGAVLYVHDTAGIKDNILRNLPMKEMASSVVRLSMALVSILTYPLTFILPAEIIASYLRKADFRQFFLRSRYQSLPQDDDTDNDENALSFISVSIRVGLLCATTLIALFVPCFGLIISLLGAFTVSITSFVLPPVLHLLILTHPTKRLIKDSLPTSAQPKDSQSAFRQDIGLTVCGLFLTAIATIVSCMNFYNQLSTGASCSSS